MEGIVLGIHILVCLLLVVIVLLQSGKSADLAGAFGGGGSQSTFGPRGTASILSKMTTTLAILFMVTSLTLWIIADTKGGSGTQTVLTQEDEVKQEETGTTGTETGKEADKTGETKAEETKTDDIKTQTETEKKEATQSEDNSENKSTG